ncbi:hypothetical protein C490_16249 [Natronobacterium gregoryi SP2]|uniref:Uncharacterized protein n=1 Tax=Natronobacterium gregoryi (strain ATCC 43098 / DSM 3393 / CCM 3738 / CIP 104747 / IAM 13177 / JCM 8860 / NBRC 102187 / NCIMB 2189 / SP2) TaxID=797304 RepID=L9XS38_NATGS|nr:hypothetical protein C490_16249 [Natronobacterium gregoryi SP2]
MLVLPEERVQSGPAAEVADEPQTEPRDPDSFAIGIVFDSLLEMDSRRVVECLVDGRRIVRPINGQLSAPQLSAK